MRKESKLLYKTPLWKRFFAYIIDEIVISIVVVLPFNYIFKEKIAINELSFLIYNNPSKLASIIIAGLVIAVLSVVYWTLFEYFLSQSIGKMLLNIKVISLKGSLRFSQCLLRNITKFSSLILFLDCLHMMNGRGMRYFDELSKTKVVETWQKNY